MNYIEFLTQVIERGIKSCSADPIINKHPKRLEGSIEGFNACRDKTPEELAALLAETRRKGHNARLDSEGKREDDLEDYWKARHYELQVEWVCNCVSAMLMNEGKGVIIPPTARAMINISEIIGVSG